MDTRQTRPIILTVPAFEDFRGYLAVPYDQSINFTVRQINQGYSKKAFTLRGMHFQEGEHAQAKLNIINLRKKWKGICSQVPFIVLKYRQGCI